LGTSWELEIEIIETRFGCVHTNQRSQHDEGPLSAESLKKQNHSAASCQAFYDLFSSGM
jgi:hypothetical protein